MAKAAKLVFALLLFPAFVSSFRKYTATNFAPQAKAPHVPRGLNGSERPNIGIVALPKNDKFEADYVQAAFVRWLHAAGAYVIPISTELSNEEIDEIVSQLNGVLYTGGPKKPTSFPGYFRVVTRIYQNVMKAHTEGEWLPLWGTCLGFQAISDIAAGGKDVLDDYKGVLKTSLPLVWHPDHEESRLFKGISGEVKELFERPTTNNRHSYGITPETFEKYLLPAGYRLISTNVDKDGKPFVSTMEHKDVPIYGVQWHPEASLFNDNSWIERLPEDIRASQYIANFFVGECRKNSRRPKTKLTSIDDYPRKRVGIWKEHYYVLSNTTPPPTPAPAPAPPDAPGQAPAIRPPASPAVSVEEGEGKVVEVNIKIPVR